eukprot:scaffold5278_cov128-Amphora_coffeaeformis.AAC.4
MFIFWGATRNKSFCTNNKYIPDSHESIRQGGPHPCLGRRKDTEDNEQEEEGGRSISPHIS